MPPGPLWDATAKAAIIKYTQNGGGIAAVHNATDMGTSQPTWDWWDGNSPNSVVGATMAGHAATSLTNVAQVQVADKNHLSTKDLPDQYGMGDEHYNFQRNVRGSAPRAGHARRAHVQPGRQRQGPGPPDHVVQALRRRRTSTTTPGLNKAYRDGRTWVTAMGHFGASYTENGGNNPLVKQIVGGTAWVAGGGKKTDCSGTVWSGYRRTVLVADANQPIGIDVSKDGKVYWSEAGLAGHRRQPVQLRGLDRHARSEGRPGQQDHGRGHPDARRPRQLRGRRPRLHAAAGLRSRGPEQASRVRVLLAAPRRR